MEERRRVELEKKIEERTTRIRLEDMEMNDII
jgi:hypothetical protein